MIKVCFGLTLLFSLGCGHATSQAPHRADLIKKEEEIVRLYHQAVQCRGSLDCDVASLDSKLATMLSEWLANDTRTFHHDFLLLQNSGLLDLYMSDDRKLKIYSWHKMPYTSMVSAYTVFQYKTDTSVQTEFKHDQKKNIIAVVSKMEKIISFRDQDKAYYILIKNSILSGNEFVQSIEVTQLRNDTLVRSVPLFKTRTQTFGSIDFTFLRSSVTDDRDTYNLIQYDGALKTILIPVVDEELQVKDSYLKYTWDGRYFKYQGVVK
jgi:hypothetical protein